jgi:hypothetical protein
VASKKDIDHAKLDAVVAAARKARDSREQSYRAKALKLYPWVCGRCQREFDHSNLHELTVHHRNHDHDDNPDDGSNWELLCLYCHDNEHQKQQQSASVFDAERETERGSHQPFADLGALLKSQESEEK